MTPDAALARLEEKLSDRLARWSSAADATNSTQLGDGVRMGTKLALEDVQTLRELVAETIETELVIAHADELIREHEHELRSRDSRLDSRSTREGS